jgi:hypothetical protein
VPLKGPLLALGLAALASVATPAPNDRASSPGISAGRTNQAWAEVKWPFLMDQWGSGRTYRCHAAECGAEVNLYLRPKIGFCNCATGVSDDAEVDRVADVDLLGSRYVPLSEGRPIRVGWMNGRSRRYAVDDPSAPRRTALAIAFNDKCDVIVATLVAGRDLPEGAERAALAFLNGKHVLRWAKAELGLK